MTEPTTAKTRQIFIVSDGTAITAETLAHSIMTQFPDLRYHQTRIPFVNTVEKAIDTARRINAVEKEEGTRPIIFTTFVEPDIMRSFNELVSGHIIDLFRKFVGPLETEFGMKSAHSIGQTHKIRDDEKYNRRIAAIDYTLTHDDGQTNRGRDEADGGRLALYEVLQCQGLTTAPEAPAVTIGNGVKKQKVTFHNRFLIDMVGDLYFPANYSPAKKYAAIIVGHPFGGVKEQTSGLHARKLAEIGYVTLAFDASYYGESGGYPRRMESPEVRVDDFSAAVDCLTKHPAGESDKIGVIGICGGGCYSVSATQIDHRIKALATISMYDMGRARRQGIGDTQTYQRRMSILDEIGRQRTAEYDGAARKDIRALPEKVDENTPKFAIDFLDYYDNPKRGQHPNSTGYYSYTSLAPMMNFFPFTQIETISPRPLLFIVGENAVSKYFSEDAYEKAAEPKELFVVPGATHVDLYDQPEYLKITLPKLDTFFKQYLK